MRPSFEVKGLTPQQGEAYMILRQLCDISVSWKTIKGFDIENPITFIRERYMSQREVAAVNSGGGSLYIPIHDQSGAAQCLTGVADAALSFYEETGEWAAHFAKAYASSAPIPESYCRGTGEPGVRESNAEYRRTQLAFVAWLEARGFHMRKNRTGKWLMLVKEAV